MKSWNFTSGWSLKTVLVNSAYCLTMMNILMISNPGQAAEQEALPIEFLEFLGEGIVIEDEYLDPLNYTDIEQDEMAKNKIEKSNNEQAGEVKNDEN